MVQGAVAKWESLRRHDLGKEARAELISSLLKEVQGSFPAPASTVCVQGSPDIGSGPRC